MALRLCRRWNREPGWFRGLPRARQIEVLAELNLGAE